MSGEMAKYTDARDERMRMLMDSRSTFDLAKHPISHGRSRHIETRFHFLRDQVNKEKLEQQHCKTRMQLVDLLKKPLKASTFEKLRKIWNGGQH